MCCSESGEGGPRCVSRKQKANTSRLCGADERCATLKRTVHSLPRGMRSTTSGSPPPLCGIQEHSLTLTLPCDSLCCVTHFPSRIPSRIPPRRRLETPCYPPPYEGNVSPSASPFWLAASPHRRCSIPLRSAWISTRGGERASPPRILPRIAPRPRRR